MSEPPRPPGDGTFGDAPDPTAPQPPPQPPQPGGYPPAPPPPGAYGAPTGPGYLPPGGYPPSGNTPGGYPPSAGYGSSDDKMWSLVAHFGGAVGALFFFGVLGFVSPLVAYLAKGQQSPTVRAQSIAALNFQLLWSIIALVVLTFSWCLLFIPTLIVIAIQVIFGIVGGVRANEGQLYQYPMSYAFIK